MKLSKALEIAAANKHGEKYAVGRSEETGHYFTAKRDRQGQLSFIGYVLDAHCNLIDKWMQLVEPQGVNWVED
jgi:hypothetical protein